MNRLGAVLCAVMLMPVGVGVAFSADQSAVAAAPTDPLADNISKLKSTDASVRRQAAEALGTIRNPAAVEPLRQALNDESPFVRSSVLDALGLLRAQSATKDIIVLLQKDKESGVRQSAAVALNYIGDQSAVPALIAALSDPSDGTRFAAANTLGSLRNPTALSALEDGLNDKSLGMRRSCLNAIGRIEDPSSLPAIRGLFKDEDPSIRAEAIRISGQFKDKQSAPAFRAALKDSDVKVSLLAAGALAHIGSSEGLSTALKAMAGSDISMRIQAAEILGNIGGKDAVAALEKAKSDPDAVVQQVAQNSLLRIQTMQPAIESAPAPVKKTKALPKKIIPVPVKK